MKQTRNLITQSSVAEAANHTNILLLPVGSSNESWLNGYASDGERARLVEIAYKARLRQVAATQRLGQLWLVMVATSAALVATAENTARSSIEEVLDALIGNEYSYQVLAHEFVTPILVKSDLTAFIHEGSIQATYTPPKGNTGLFVSDEQLDEPETNSYLCLIVTWDQADAADTRFVSHWVKISYEVSQRPLRLSEV